MSIAAKELAVALVISVATFALARPIALNFCSPRDYSRRRNGWLALTAAVFLAPNFWIFAAISAPLLIFLRRKESNPSAMFVFLMYAVPPGFVVIPMVGLSYLLRLDFHLLLSLCVMTPVALQLLSAQRPRTSQGPAVMDLCLILYCALAAAHYVLPEVSPGILMTPTAAESVKRAVVSLFTLVVPYFVISRSIQDRRRVLETLAFYCLGCALFSTIAIFESARHWLLYNEVVARWSSNPQVTTYGLRGQSIRAVASTGQPLALGLLLAVAFGIWLGLQAYLKSRLPRLIVAGVFCGGLIAAYARGAWMGAAFMYFALAALRPRALSKIVKASLVAVLFAMVVAATPLGGRISQVLPLFGGETDTQDILYRHELFDRGWQIVAQSPLLGDPHALLKMQHLRQGQGIIDLVNGYLLILLNDGVIGLGLYMSFMLGGFMKAWGTSRRVVETDPKYSLVGGSLAASICGVLLIMAGDGMLDLVMCVLSALAVAYSEVSRLKNRQTSLALRAVADDRNVY